MAQPREIDPITRTYLDRTRSRSGKSKIHARVYARGYDVDRRATNDTVAGAVDKILAMLPAPRPRPRRRAK